MMKTRLSSILTTTCFAICGWFFVQPRAANALSLTLDGRGGGAYLYTVQLSANESLAVEDELLFQNLAGVTAVNADAPYRPNFIAPDEVHLRAQTNTLGPDTFNVAIFSSAAPGRVNYTAEYQDSDPDFGNIRSFNTGSIIGPAGAQAVPFELSPGPALLFLLALFGVDKGRKSLMGNTILPKAREFQEKNAPSNPPF